MTTDNIHSLTAPYALDALNDLERRQFEDHLAAGCDTCADELSGYLEVAAALGSMHEEPISPSLRTAVATIPDTVRQVGPPIRSSTTPRWARRLTSVAAAMLMVATVGLGAAVVDQRQQIDSLEDRAAVAALLERPDATLATQELDGSVVRIVTSEMTGEAAVLATGLDRLPEDRTYQLWVIDDDGPTGAGFLEIGDDGAGGQLLDRSVRGGDAVGITIEPAGGSDAPTTTPIAVVETA